MGGSGGGGSSWLSDKDLQNIRNEAQERLARSRSDAEINRLLQSKLAQINDRDVEQVDRRLDEIETALRGSFEEFDKVRFGGSVAKHTYVDGLSDIDCLVVFDGSVVGERTPTELRAEVRDILSRHLDMGQVRAIRAGLLAVTVTYRDGLEIQLLPAVGQGDAQAISSPDGEAWARIDPKSFSDRLTRANTANAGALVPAVKLAKSLLAGRLADNERPSGYHIEALALAAFADYEGARTPKAMVQRFFDQAARDVLRPIPDVTGQSEHLDAVLGPAGSPDRRGLSRRFQQIGKALRDAVSASAWDELIQG